MSQVHSVTDVPVHSPLSEVCLPCWRAAQNDQGGRCGQERGCYETCGAAVRNSLAGDRQLPVADPEKKGISGAENAHECCECGGLLASAWIVDEKAGIRLTPVLKHAH